MAFNMDLLKLTVLGVTLLLSLDVVLGSENPGVGIQDFTGHPIWVKCQSKDTQFDPRTMQNGDIWKWSFTPNFGGSTLYWCVFWWNKLGADFVVWDINTAPIYDHSINDWRVQDDGFYLYDPVKNVWNKLHVWAPASSADDSGNVEMGRKGTALGTNGRGIIKRPCGDYQGALDDMNLAYVVRRRYDRGYDILQHRGYVKHLMKDEAGAREDAEAAHQLQIRYIEIEKLGDVERLW